MIYLRKGKEGVAAVPSSAAGTPHSITGGGTRSEGAVAAPGIAVGDNTVGEIDNEITDLGHESSGRALKAPRAVVGCDGQRESENVNGPSPIDLIAIGGGESPFRAATTGRQRERRRPHVHVSPAIRGLSDVQQVEGDAPIGIRAAER